jgi:CRP-like cAMP-binding protein
MLQWKLVPIQKKLDSIPEGIEVSRRGKGESFGELALKTSMPRDYNAYCPENCYFLVIRKKYFKKILQKRIEKRQEDLQNFLLETPIIKEFTRGKILRFMSYLTFIEYNYMGEVV